jgi:hypothetical protein
MIEPCKTIGVVRKIGEDVLLLDVKETIRNVLGVNELNGVNALRLRNENGTT